MASEPAPTIYTIGHSRHSLDAFIGLLKQNRIERVVDVRGQPYSRYNPQFNREHLSRRLEESGIDYTWSGRHLSGRPQEGRFYDSQGNVLWDKLMTSPELIAALDSIAVEIRLRRIALVCAEEDPMRCHRRFLLTPPLIRRGIQVMHLRGDGRTEPESELKERDAPADASPHQDLFQ